MLILQHYFIYMCASSKSAAINKKNSQLELTKFCVELTCQEVRKKTYYTISL